MLKGHVGIAVQVLFRQARPVRQRVAPPEIHAGRDRRQLVELQLPGVQQPPDDLLRQIRQADDADIRPVVIDIVDDAVHSRLPQSQAEAVLIRDLEQPQKSVRHKGIPLAGHQEPNGCRAVPGLTVQPLDPPLLLQQRHGIAEELLPLRRKFHAPVAAGQQCDPQFALQFPDGGGNARLREEQLLRGLVDGAAFGDLHNVLQLLKCHR